MRYFFIMAVLIASVTLTKNATDHICLEETDEEICESFHLQCGVTIHMTDYCGEEKDVECICHVGESCSLNDFSCRQ